MKFLSLYVLSFAVKNLQTYKNNHKIPSDIPLIAAHMLHIQ